MPWLLSGNIGDAWIKQIRLLVVSRVGSTRVRRGARRCYVVSVEPGRSKAEGYPDKRLDDAIVDNQHVGAG